MEFQESLTQLPWQAAPSKVQLYWLLQQLCIKADSITKSYDSDRVMGDSYCPTQTCLESLLSMHFLALDGNARSFQTIHSGNLHWPLPFWVMSRIVPHLLELGRATSIWCWIWICLFTFLQAPTKTHPFTVTHRAYFNVGVDSSTNSPVFSCVLKRNSWRGFMLPLVRPPLCQCCQDQRGVAHAISEDALAAMASWEAWVGHGLGETKLQNTKTTTQFFPSQSVPDIYTFI